MDKRTIDYNELYDLYVIKKLTIKEICKTLHAGGHTISRELKRYNLTRRPEECNVTHKMSKTRIYKIWQGMKTRCDNPKSINYLNYGGKGITYDNRWKKFEVFWNDMKGNYSHDLTLDRIDNKKGYCKENCRWVSYKVQNNNRRNNIKAPITAKKIAKITGLSLTAIYGRFRKGWTIKKIINTPKLSNNGKEKMKIGFIKRSNYIE